MTLDNEVGLTALGITRLAEQGTLDTLGITIWAAIRPAARSLVVTNGKGTNSTQARICAIMEAFECACAEDWERLTIKFASINELLTEDRQFIDLRRFLKCHPKTLDPNVRRHWVAGHVADQEPTLVPYEMVGLDLTIPSRWDQERFGMCSVGIAAHPDRDRAISAALLEAIENDARAIATALPGHAAQCPRLDPDTLNEAWITALKAKLIAASSWLELIDITTDIALPTVLCLIRGYASGTSLQMRHAGCACRGTYKAAAEAAIMEATQSRATHIAGARDDITSDSFATRHTSDVFPKTLTPIPTLEKDAPFPNFQTIQKYLTSAELNGAPVICELSPLGSSASCVSVLVPDLELVSSSNRPVRHGPRLAKYALRQLVT